MNRTVLIAALSTCLIGISIAQESAQENQPSLADVARQTRERNKSAKPKVVITDETIAATKGPIPELRVDGVDNSKEIIAAIDRFRFTHTPQQTEAAVRDWFESEDSQMAYELSQTGQSPSILNSYYEFQDRPATTYKQSQERQLSQIRNFEVNRRSAAESAERRGHFQTRLVNVRTGIRALGLNYEWFKIRCLGNSDCSY